MSELAAREKISVVSPVYGCRDCLNRLVDRVRSSLDDRNCDWELILVDDRGPDEPWDDICALSEVDPRVRGLRLSKNHGQHLAIWAGLEVSRGDWVAVVDCDLQDDPDIIPELLKQAARENLEAIVVERGAWEDTWFRRFGSNVFRYLVGVLSGVRLSDSGNFGLYSRKMVDSLLEFKEQEVFLPLMVVLTGLKRGRYQLDRSNRFSGHSSYSLTRLVRMAVAVIVRFSDRPLKLSVFVGLLFSVLSFLFTLGLLVGWSLGAIVVPGWTSIVLSVWFLSGLILASLGVHGIYLGRVFSEVKSRPRITVDSVTPSE